MKIERKTTISVLSSTGEPLIKGTTYLFEKEGKNYVGEFTGVIGKSGVGFKNVLPPYSEYFVKPSNVGMIYPSIVDIEKGSDDDE